MIRSHVRLAGACACAILASACQMSAADPKGVVAARPLAIASGAAGAPRPAPQVEGPAASASCNKPVILVVLIEHLDRSKSKAYGENLRSFQVVPRNGGQYIPVSPPLRVLEGQWPADRGFVSERYPCLAAFEAMWYSDQYQKKLVPLRDGSGHYTTALFRERPAPPQRRR
jgi:uncharacterized protein (DUF1330 family)